MNKCQVEDCHNKCFEKEDKCILHCDKNEDNNWYKLNKNCEKEWSKKKVNSFWGLIQKDLDNDYINYMLDRDIVYNKYILSHVIFPKFQEDKKYFSPAMNEHELGTNFYSYRVFEHHNQQPMPEVNRFFNKRKIIFKECTFLDIANFKKYNFKEDIVFNKCIFTSEIELNKLQEHRISFLWCPKIKNLNLSNIIFKKKVEIKECTLNSCNFDNTRFEKVCDFYKTHFYENCFNKTTFEDISVFTESKFHEKINFRYTTFAELALFRKTVFEDQVDFEDSIIKEEANFLEISAEIKKIKDIKPANRETARIIKNSFEQQNNIIEANRFYALEMRAMEKELTFFKNPLEWLIFKIHSISSDHSQSWFLALFWILYFTFMFSFLDDFYNDDNIVLSNIVTLLYIEFSLIIGLLLGSINNRYKHIISMFTVSMSYFIYGISSNDFTLKCFSNNINPFSIMTGKETITFGLLFYKITIAYLIYQLIISVRQNTRRK